VTWWKVTTSGAAEPLHFRRHTSAGWPTARRAFQFFAQTRRPIPKCWVLQITVSVRSARPSLKYCLIREDGEWEIPGGL
jgi:hypothetical protein